MKQLLIHPRPISMIEHQVPENMNVGISAWDIHQSKSRILKNNDKRCDGANFCPHPPSSRARSSVYTVGPAQHCCHQHTKKVAQTRVECALRSLKQGWNHVIINPKLNNEPLIQF